MLFDALMVPAYQFRLKVHCGQYLQYKKVKGEKKNETIIQTADVFVV